MSNSVSAPSPSLLALGKKLFRSVFPAGLRGFRTSVVPTRQGVVFFAMLLALLLGSINHNNNLGYILTFLLAGMALVSVFYTFRNLSGLELVSARAAPVFAGQHAVFKVRLMVSRRTRPGIALYFPGGEMTTVTLREQSAQIVSVIHATEKRGLLEPSVLCLATSYPLGFFRVRSTIEVNFSCPVYPRPVPGPLVTARGPLDEEAEGEAGGPGVEDFSGLAAYQRGDALQHISWKTYSRGQGLYTKKFEGQQGKTVYFNPDVLAGGDMELKLSRICAMILKADNLRLSYGLQLGSKVIPPDSGGRHKRRCLQELALVPE
jgi:uncharacterized protein (DUF58 family)